MKYLRPLILREGYYHPIEVEIQRIFNAVLYRKIFTLLHATEITNAINSLLDAIRAGRIWYENGEFKGKFSARTSSQLLDLGAKYHTGSRTYFLPDDQLPTDIRFAQANADDRMRSTRKHILDTIDDAQTGQLDLFDDIKKTYDTAIDRMQFDLDKTMTTIEVKPKITPAMRDRLSKDYAYNLDLYIKNWIDEDIPKLREKVEQHAIAGGRAEALVATIQENYDVSRNKAKFLARQETSLLMSKFREARYADIGIGKYKWSGANDERERPDHKALNGKVFSFSNPPVTNRKTGARNNPGEDFGCRCVAIPIVE